MYAESSSLIPWLKYFKLLSLANIYCQSAGYMVLKINAIRISRVNIFKSIIKKKRMEKEKNET